MKHLGDRLVFGALQASLGWSRSFLQKGALVLFTANGAHRSSRGYLLAIGDAGMAGAICLLRGLCHGQKCLHLFSDSEAYHEQMGQYPGQMEA